MNLTSSYPFWSVSNGLPENFPSLQRDVACAVVVIDGGITGALAAVHLVEAGVKTVLIDRRDIGTAMKHWEHTRRGVRLTTQNGFQITARRCVAAAGFQAKALLNGAAGTLKSTYAFISEPLPPVADWYEQCLIWDSGSPDLYLRTTSEGRIIVGGEDEDFVNAKRRDNLISRKTRTLVRKFGRLIPDLPLEVAYAWAGTFGETKDGLPFIGVHPRFPHAYVTLGYGGEAITFSLLAAEIIRDACLRVPNPEAHIFRFGR